MWSHCENKMHVDINEPEDRNNDSCKHLVESQEYTGYDTHVTVPQGQGTGEWADIDNC